MSLTDASPNVSRTVIEGLRIWTGRPYLLKEHPVVTMRLISQQHVDESEYLRKSVGNSLRGIKNRFPELIEAEISSWSRAD